MENGMIDRNLKGTWWWGYLHSNGTVQLKSWHGDHEDYTGDCKDNPFVLKVVRPFEADTREAAWKLLNENINN